ncbi:MAG TPA: ABC transporter ATP-binding protein [Yinghuangia sp.]|nr:ABC transporter ATP-binding protein [Yinghuangia sp.]
MPTASDPEVLESAVAETAGETSLVRPDPKDQPLAVKVDNLSITYRTSIEKVPTLKSAIKRVGRRERSIREIEAVRDVSWSINHGTVLGVVGANGAGKSTMLRAIAGILPPTKGRIEVHGRVSTLLALGVGFNSQLTGRENVILGGLAQGKAESEVQAKYEEIADFAELGEFMDMPMKSYSSGMYQRLAFSVGVHMDPDILLVDEALSAGDARFKRKAAAKMDELCRAARTIILVSHGMASVREMANHCLWLHKGKLMDQGDPETIIGEYMRFLEVGEEAFAMEDV